MPPPPLGQRLVRVDVKGMEDAASVARVKHHLSVIQGVQHVEVNLEKGRAEVVCEDSVTDSSLIAAVGRAGPNCIGLVAY